MNNSIKAVGLFLLSVIVSCGADYRILDGKLYDVQRAVGWENVAGNVVTVLSNGVIAQVVTKRDRFQPAEVNAYGAQTRPRRFIGTEVELGPKFYVANAPQHVRLDDAILNLEAFPRGTTNINGATIKAYDYGKIATTEEVREEFKKRGLVK